MRACRSSRAISNQSGFWSDYRPVLPGNTLKIEVGSYEAKTKLPELLRQVKSGESFTITNHGKAVAGLVPSAGAKVKDKVAAVAKLKAFRRAEPVPGVDLRALIEAERA